MSAAIKLDAATLDAIEASLCAESLTDFIECAWPILEPATVYKSNWHIDAICEHLQAVSNGEIRNLLINMPPRCMKSLSVNVMWPAWEWTHAPSTRWLTSSYSQTLSTRDAVKMRRLIMSPWYQSLWGDKFALAGDQNAKMRFENDKQGHRIATSVGAMATGEGGDRVLVDDPHSAQGAKSDADRMTALEWWDETMSTRLNDPQTGAKVIVMQRLHEQDLSGHVLEQGGYEHLMLPAEYEPSRHCVTCIWEDPRKKAGDLLWPDRLDREVLADYEKRLGAYGFAGQMQQSPIPKSGGLFDVTRFQYLDKMPPANDIAASIRYWDKAGTEGGGAYTAGVLIHRLKDGRFLIADVVRGQWSAHNRERQIKSAAERDGKNVKIWIEQEGGSGGKESAQSTIKNLAGYSIKADRVTGAKEIRAEPYSDQVEGENVYILRRDWTTDFVNEHKVFPVGKYKDQVDAAAGAMAKLITTGDSGALW